MGQVNVTPSTVEMGEDFTIQGIPEPGNTMNTMGYLEKEGQFLSGFALDEMPDGTLEAVLSTFDWQPGTYQARIYEPGLSEYIYSNPFEVLAPAVDPYQVFKDALGEDRMALFDVETQQKVPNIIPGKKMVLVVSTEGLSHVKTSIELNWTQQSITEIFLRLKIIHIPEESIDPSTLSESCFAQYFIIQHLPYLDLSAPFTFNWEVTSEGDTSAHIESLSGQIVDTPSEEPIQVNTGLLYKRFSVGIFYYGSTLTDDELETCRSKLENELLEATKNYYAVEAFIAGKAPLPPEGPTHPYSDWWESLPHNLGGTQWNDDILSLDDPFYETKLKHMWYYHNGGKQKILMELQDIYPALWNGEDLTIYITDAGFEKIAGAAGNGFINKSFTSGHWMVMVNGEEQYKDPSTWEKNDPDLIVNVWIHESGHVLFRPASWGDDKTKKHPFSTLVYVEDDSRPLAHKNCYMSYYRNRETNEDIFYFDEHLAIALAVYAPPEVIIDVTPSEASVGEEITITLTGHSKTGLNAIWWWGENTGLPEMDKAHWHGLSGEEDASHTWTVTFPAPGTYVICANARDIEYPSAGEAHQASEGTGIVCTEVVITGTQKKSKQKKTKKKNRRSS